MPKVNTVDQAQAVIEHAEYPPFGSRGGPRCANSLYCKVVATDYLSQANADTFIVVQAETATAIDNVDAIASVAGLESVLVGSMDLPVSLGIGAQVTHPDEVAGIDHVIAVCQERNITSGIMMFGVPTLKTWTNKSIRFVVCSSDISLLADVAADGVKALKSAALN